MDEIKHELRILNMNMGFVVESLSSIDDALCRLTTVVENMSRGVLSKSEQENIDSRVQS